MFQAGSRGRRVNKLEKTKDSTSQVAELALVESLQHLLEGGRVDTYVALERVIEGSRGEERQGDDHRQRRHHERVHQGVLQAEEVGEPYRDGSSDLMAPPTISTTHRMVGIYQQCGHQ
jgi:hypothetical protein